MTTPARPPFEPELIEPPAPDVGPAARDLFAHGLLESLHLDTPESRTQRLERLFAALRHEPIAGPWRFQRWRLVSGLAAAVAIAVTAMLAVPTRGTAAAMVQAAKAASRTAGDRRYEVRAMLPHETEADLRPIGTVDVRDADHVVIRSRTPRGDQVVVGRNGSGAWAIRPDGQLDMFPPKRAWPPWVNFGQSTVPLASVDELMAWLDESYTLNRLEDAAPPSAPGVVCDRIRALRRPGSGPTPARIELWIDHRSHVVRRMELNWGPGQRPRHEGGPRPGPPPPPLGEGRGGGPPGPRPDGPPPPRHRPPRPEFVDGPPDFDGGHHPPPPRQIILELIDGAHFDDKWFEPGTHTAVRR